MKRNIIIRADGGSTIGMGHVVRCLALADMLKKEFNIVFAIQKPSDIVLETVRCITNNIIQLPATTDFVQDLSNFIAHLKINDIVILDGYDFRTEYQLKIRDKGCKLVCIDDLHSWHQLADVIINHAVGINEEDYSAEDYTKFCLGLDYVLLRKEFLNVNTPLRKINSIRKVFISMGAADPNNVTQKFTEALLQIKDIEEIHLMLSSINPNLKSLDILVRKNLPKIIPHFNLSAKKLADLLGFCDISVCPASSISLESCATGIGLVSGYTAENQLSNLKGMKQHKTLINFGDMNLLSVDAIKTKFIALIKHPEKLNELTKNQKQMIDGKSPERLLKVFKSI